MPSDVSDKRDARADGPAMVGRWLDRYPFLTAPWAERLLRCYGTEAETILGSATTLEDLGEDFGATLTEAELRFLVRNEFARTAEDVLWRRTKLGLRLDKGAVPAVEAAMARLVADAEQTDR